MNYYKRIDKLNMEADSKEGYKWLFANIEAVYRKTKNCKTIGDVRKKCFREIGFAPAILFSSHHLFESKETFILALEKHF